MQDKVKIKKNILGKYVISYDCPQCGDGLKSPIDDAGKSDQCPNCHIAFFVPGKEESDRIRNDLKQALEQQKATAETARQLEIAERTRLSQERAGLTHTI